jgi:HlyD family secretion protein
MWPSRRRIALALALVGAASVGAIYWAGRQKQPQYQTVRVERGNIEASISATGTCNAEVTVQVGSQVSGNIKALYADFNTHVNHGQLVALIDPALFEARVQQSRASLDSARAAVVSAQAGVQRAAADIAAAQANAQTAKSNVSKANVALVDAKTKLDRRAQLLRQGLIAKEDLDTAQAAYDSARDAKAADEAQLTAANSNISAAEAQRQVALTQLTSAQAQVKQAQATLQQAEVDLEHTQIRAPVDGTVVARRMDVGQTVAASFQAPTIFEIAQDLKQMQVDANIDESDIGRVREKQQVNFTVDAYPGTTFAGTVRQIRKAPINTQNVITYDVVVAVDNPDLKLFPGMTANVRILTAEHDAVLKIPNSALRYRPAVAPTARDAVHAAAPGRQTIYVLDEQGKARPVQVKLGLTDGTFTEIQSGDIREGEEVVVGVAGKATGQPATGRPPTGGGRRGPGF